MENSVSNIAILFIVGTSFLLILACVVIHYQRRVFQKKIITQAQEADYQKRLLLSTIDSQEKERKKIASDLHDGVGAMLSAAKLNLNMLSSGSILKEDLGEAIKESKDMIDETIATVRRISKDLFPASLGLSNAIHELCEKFDSPKTIVKFIENGEAAPLSQQHELLIFRMVQELLNNAIQHADATHINIGIQWDQPITVTVEDDGVGFNLEEVRGNTKKGVGLYSIENRASLIGAEVVFKSKIGKGAVIKIIINKTDE